MSRCDLITTFTRKRLDKGIALSDLFKSVVLSTFSSDKFVLAAATVLAPVPPFATATTPVILPALTLIIFESVMEPSVIETPATAAST